MEVTLGQQYNVGEKPTVILYTHQTKKNRNNVVQLLLFLFLEMLLFPSIFCTIAALSLYGEVVVHSFFPRMVFFYLL